MLQDGTAQVNFDNGTTLSIMPKPDENAAPYERAVAIEWTRDYNNGTEEIKYFNGTHVRTNE